MSNRSLRKQFPYAVNHTLIRQGGSITRTVARFVSEEDAFRFKILMKDLHPEAYWQIVWDK